MIVKFIDSRLQENLPPFIKLIRINTRTVGAYQPAPVGVCGHLRNGPPNSSAQAVLSYVGLRHHTLLNEPGTHRDQNLEPKAGHHQSIDTLATGPPGYRF